MTVLVMIVIYVYSGVDALWPISVSLVSLGEARQTVMTV